MATQDPNTRCGEGMTCPQSKPVQKLPANTAPAGHHAKVEARINRGHGKSMSDHPNLVPFNPGG